MRCKITGYDTVQVDLDPAERQAGLRLMRHAADGILDRHGLAPGDAADRELSMAGGGTFVDKVPVSCAEIVWDYRLIRPDGSVADRIRTDPAAWPRDGLPWINIPSRPDWEAIYEKAWDLTWRRIVTSRVIPARFAYNDYPDNHMTYVWDTCFCTLFQRYAAPAGLHPCMKTLDSFYAMQQADGFIARNINVNTRETVCGMRDGRPKLESVNPPLFAWAEWNYYQLSADRSRLANVLPHVTAQYRFIERFLKEGTGHYRWNRFGAGWDNLNDAEGELHYWVELPAMQALSAECIAAMARAIGEVATAAEFDQARETQRKAIEPYWNSREKWYCSLTRNGNFARKTLGGMWPFLAGLVPPEHARTVVRDTLLNQATFLTAPMPLPTLARDEPGYNPMGEYWRGSVWINMSLVTVRGLDRAGFRREATELAAATLDGIARAYREWEPAPETLWECYAPEYAAPASHKDAAPDRLGTVRSDFGGWTGCLVNLLIENVLGLRVDAPANKLIWEPRFRENYAIRNLRFGEVCADLEARFDDAGAVLTLRTHRPFTLEVLHHSMMPTRQQHAIPAGEQTIRLAFDNDMARGEAGGQ